MEIAERYLPLAFGTFHFNNGIQRNEGDAHIRWMNSDTLVAGSKERVHTVNTRCSGTAASWLPLVTRESCVVVVGAASTLQHIAADGSNVANLLRGTGQNRPR